MVISCKLSDSILALENYLLTNSNQADMDVLRAIQSDYQLMAEYWQRGFVDPQREQVYDKLLRRMYVLTSNVSARNMIAHSPYLTSLYQRPRMSQQDWSISDVRTAMETFVTDVTMLELEPEHSRGQKSSQLYKQHWQLMNDLFEYTLTSRQWRGNEASAFLDMLLSPTLASIDQQLIVSAITISAIQSFCFQKFRVLCEVFRQSTDEPLRQRALVGWVLAAGCNQKVWNLYTEMTDIIDDLCRDQHTQAELSELQLQLIYCENTDADIEAIQKEILPDIMNGSKLRMTRNGLVEQDDTLEDILHPEDSDKAIERMEQSVQRMMDMQKQGSDIFYAGFSQIKRFPFFDYISNWFVPFYSQHPGISDKWNNSRYGKFLKMITRDGSFCDSDKYSMVLAFDQVASHMPQEMAQMLEKNEAVSVMGMDTNKEERKQPSYIRRVYLQDIYRFFRLYSVRSEFTNPFKEVSRLIFFANPVFSRESLSQEAITVTRFLMKRHLTAYAISVLNNIPTSQRDLNFYLLMGSALQNATGPSSLSATDCYRRALQLQPDNVRAQSGLARSLFACKQYEEALQLYRQLTAQQPDQRSYQLNTAVCLLNLGKAEEAQNMLFKLRYLHDDDLTVKRILAWALTIDGKCQQAEKLYEQLMEEKDKDSQDILNYAYCLWLSKKIEDAIAMFRTFAEHMQGQDFNFRTEFMNTEHQMLSNNKISDVEIQLMIDFVTN
ncbi:MAG: tetratricopeptide repeat protein [Prevotella sp.]|nr:tetratricopeptide repeat protein [Prevotella sp.]